MQAKVWSMVLLMAAAAGACCAVSGLDEFEMDDGSTYGAGAGNTGGPDDEGPAVCGNGVETDPAYTCVPLAMEPMFISKFGWEECEGAYTSERYFVCDACYCTSTSGSCEVTGTLFADTACAQSPTPFTATDCTSVSAPVAAGSAMVTGAAVAVPGYCDPWYEDHYVCRLLEGETCATTTSVCALVEKLEQPCVLVNGTECPSGYIAHTAGIRQELDQCGCSCSKEFETTDCYGSVKLWPYQSCEGGFDELGSISSVEPSCQTFDAPMMVSSFEPPMTEVTCATGAITPTGTERTLCCQE